jgi:hypothetical protein
MPTQFGFVRGDLGKVGQDRAVHVTALLPEARQGCLGKLTTNEKV